MTICPPSNPSLRARQWPPLPENSKDPRHSGGLAYSKLVRTGRLELPPGVITRHGPEPCASADSATSANPSAPSRSYGRLSSRRRGSGAVDRSNLTRVAGGTQLADPGPYGGAEPRNGSATDLGEECLAAAKVVEVFYGTELPPHRDPSSHAVRVTRRSVTDFPPLIASQGGALECLCTASESVNHRCRLPLCLTVCGP
jgi:hypothetical protein